MPQSSANPSPFAQLQACVATAHDLSQHPEATEAFEALRDQVALSNPQMAQMLELLWNEMLAARRSSTFWQEICDVEKELSERIAANHVQLRQNYLRLMQEQ